MFFQFNESAVREAMKKQKEQKAAEPKKHDAEYDGHKLTFLPCADGATAIESDPPLVKPVNGPESNEPHAGDVDFWSPQFGWVKRE